MKTESGYEDGGEKNNIVRIWSEENATAARYQFKNVNQTQPANLIQASPRARGAKSRLFRTKKLEGGKNRKKDYAFYPTHKRENSLALFEPVLLTKFQRQGR